MQAEIVEQLIKDKDRLATDLAKLRAEISSEASQLFKIVMDYDVVPRGGPLDDQEEWRDQMRLVRKQLERKQQQQ